MTTIYQRTKSGTYAYEKVPKWDPVTKQNRPTQKYLGKVDPETGKIVPKKSYYEEAEDGMTPGSIISVGHSLLFGHICKAIGLDTILENVFPRTWEKMLTCAYHSVCTSAPLSCCEQWSRDHASPGGLLADQRISELLGTIGSGHRTEFFTLWSRKRTEDEYLALDITSISSYSELIDQVRWGHNRDGERLPQVNLGMMVGERSGLPVYYDVYAGSINDVRTLKTFLAAASMIDLGRLHLVMDRGFYSKANVDAMLRGRHRFTVAMPFTSNLAKGLVEDAREDMDDHENYILVDDNDLFCKTARFGWEVDPVYKGTRAQQRRMYAHVFHDPRRSADDHARFMRSILQWERELIEHGEDERNRPFYDEYFIVKDTPKRGRNVSRNDDAIRGHKRNRAGYFILLSNDLKVAKDALAVYLLRDVIEKAFDDLKNDTDSRRLRVHSSRNMEGRMFIQFIALILISHIRKVMRENGLYGDHTMRTLLSEFELLREIRFKDGRTVRTEPTRSLRKVSEHFGLIL